jgi:hypothetical protein
MAGLTEALLVGTGAVFRGKDDWRQQKVWVAGDNLAVLGYKNNLRSAWVEQGSNVE